MTTVTTRYLTVEEFARRGDSEPHEELVRGKVVFMNPPKPSPGRICARIGALVFNYAMEHDLGEVVTNDAGIITERNPDTLRGADLAFYRRDRLPGGTIPDNVYLDLPPDLVVEVLSEHDRWPRVLTKLGEFLVLGVRAVVVLDPDLRTAHIYRPDTPVEILRGDDTLRVPEVLGDFQIPLSQCFG